MANIYYKFLSLFCLLLFVNVAQSFATHIRAGEITARRIDPQRPTYEITVTGYADTDSPVLFGSNGVLDYGDGTVEAINNQGESGWIPRTRISDGTWKYELTRIHTYPGQKTYQISFRELYRNEGVLNMSNSVNMPFYIETVIVIDSYLGVNNTPVLLVPPVDKAAVGKVYIHNPGAYDVDGDSLSYRLVFCKQDEGIAVANYRFPHQTFSAGSPANGTSITGGPSTFTLDPVTGDLVWDSPGTKGEYNAAFLIEEWRMVDGEYYFLGYVTRDMQIIVEDTDNQPPVLEMPNDTCVVAGTELRGIIRANDPDGDPVKIESFGGVYRAGATYSPSDGRLQENLPASVEFVWQTSCADVQDRSYAVQFRATDARGGGVSLTDLKTWNITVVAPPPSIDYVEAVDSRSARLGFSAADYFCGNSAKEIQVWRRVDSSDFQPGVCETGMPAGAGYELVSTSGINDFPFTDTNNGRGLNPGATYCYRIVAVFPRPKGGESIVSEEVCVTLPAAVPMITNVSIERTDENNGEVLVRWSPPLDIDTQLFPGPYTYDLYRAEGFSGGSYETVAVNLSDTVLIDQGLDTRNGIFNYYVMLKSAGQEVDSSATASTVRLEPEPLVGSIELRWQATVPWSNQVKSAPYHYIYRNNVPGEEKDNFVLIDSIYVGTGGSFLYHDDGTATEEDGLLDSEVYCYFVTTQGSYGNPGILSPLLNNSQKICAQPNDTIPPCGPITFELDDPLSCEEILNTDCSIREFNNALRWTANTDGSCQNDVALWEVYFSPTGEEGTFNVVGTTRTNSFVHRNLRSLAGFYFIVAVDRSGNRSEPSNLVQNDNCPNYKLPNVFTPNDDGANDFFEAPLNPVDPTRCPRFVESVRLRVYNRWGKEVYTYNSDDRNQERSIYIKWDGRDNSGDKLTPGTYYYHAEVIFTVLDPSKRKQDLRGWVQIITGDKIIHSETGAGSR